MRRTKEDAAITRENLLDAAMICFQAKGYTMTTLDDIARQAGTTRGAISWHFGGKVDLFNTLIRERYMQAMTHFFEIQKQGGTPLQILRRLLIGWLRYPEDNPDFGAMLRLTLQTEISPEMADGIREKVEGARKAIAYFAVLIQQAIDAGEVDPQVNAEIAAVSALGLINGVTMGWMMDPVAFPLASRAEAVVDLFIRGLIRTTRTTGTRS